MRIPQNPNSCRKGLAILSLAALLFPSTNTASPDSANSRGGVFSGIPQSRSVAGAAEPMMHMPMIAPLFLEDDQFSSTISMVNAASIETYATVFIRSLSGETVLQKPVPLGPSSAIQIPVRQLLYEAKSVETRGSILVEQSPDLKGLAVLAQLSITQTQGSRTSYIDEELAMPDASMGSSVLRAVGRGKGRSVAVAISSLSQSVQQIRVDCLSHQADTVSKQVELAPSATIIVEACRQGHSNSQSLTATEGAKSGNFDDEEVAESAAPAEGEAVGVQLASNAGPGQFAAFGIIRHGVLRDGIFGAVPFSDPKLAVSSNTVYAGLPVGSAKVLGLGTYRPYVSVANFSMRSAHVSISFSRTSGSSDSSVASKAVIRDITLQARRATTVPLANLQGDPELRNSFVVTSDAPPGEVAVSMASGATDGEGEVELLGKDAQQPENAGHHPWSIAHGNDSTLLVFNHTDQQQRITVAVANGTFFWQKVIKLSPLETMALSMNEIVKNQVPDDHQKTLPLDLVEGQVMWSMGSPKTTTGRLLVSNSIAVMARNFSCQSFDVLCGAGVSPTSATIYYGDNANFYASYQSCVAYNIGDCFGTLGGIASVSYNWYNTVNCGYAPSCTITGDLPLGTRPVNVDVSTTYCVFTGSASLQVLDRSVYVSTVSVSPTAITIPGSATFQVQIYHDDLTGVPAQSVTLEAGTLSTDPAGGVSVLYDPQTQPVSLSGPPGSQIQNVGVYSPTGSGSLVIKATLRNASSKVRIGAPVTDRATLQVNYLTITTSSLPNGAVNLNYSATVTATGGRPPYGWSIIAGSLPPGLTLNASSGQITGVPTTVGTSSFTVKATDSTSPSETATANLSITVQ